MDSWHLPLAVPPIHRLPNELLVEIFHHTVNRGEPSSKTFQPYLKVCKRWRTVIDQTPHLWTMVCSWEPRHLYLRTMERAGALPLHLQIAQPGWGYDNDPLFPPFVEMAGEQIHCWGSISVSAESEKVVAIFTRSHQPSNLERLDIRFSAYYGRQFTFYLFEGTDVPQLRRLTLTGLSVPWDSHLLRGLTTLSISCDTNPGSGPSAQEAADIFESCPNLATVQLQFRAIDYASPVHGLDLSPIYLTLLTSLDLKLSHIVIQYVLSRIRVPACCHLVLSTTGSHPILSSNTSHIAPTLSSILFLSASNLRIKVDRRLYTFTLTAGDVLDIECRYEDPKLASLFWVVDNIEIPHGTEVEVAVGDRAVQEVVSLMARLPQGTKVVAYKDKEELALW